MGMGYEEHFFEVPYYRVSAERWLDDLDRKMSSEAQRLGWLPLTEDRRSRLDHWARQMLYSGLGYDYNQVVGWVRIGRETLGAPVVKGDAFRVILKRVQTNFIPRYEWIQKVVETRHFYRNDSSADVAAEIRKDLMVLTKRGEVFAGRHVDLEAFDTLAPYVDWRALVGLDDSLER